MSAWNLDDETRDALIELLNIGVGRAAASLSELVGRRIALSVPTIRVYRPNENRPEWLDHWDQPGTVINQTFEGLIRGRAALCFPTDSSLALARQLSGDIGSSVDGLDAELSGILLEVGNIMLNGVVGSLANSLSAELQYSLPEIQSANRQGDILLLDSLRRDDFLIGDVRFSVSEQRIESSIVIIFAVGSVAQLVDALFCSESV